MRAPAMGARGRRRPRGTPTAVMLPVGLTANRLQQRDAGRIAPLAVERDLEAGDHPGAGDSGSWGCRSRIVWARGCALRGPNWA